MSEFRDAQTVLIPFESSKAMGKAQIEEVILEVSIEVQNSLVKGCRSNEIRRKPTKESAPFYIPPLQISSAMQMA